MSKYLTLDDIKVGDRVTNYQISGIFDTYILLSQLELNEDGSTSGTIEFIGKEQTPEMKKAFDEATKKYGEYPMIYSHTRLPNGVFSL